LPFERVIDKNPRKQVHEAYSYLEEIE